MLLVDLNDSREQVDSSGIVVFIGSPGGIPHVLDHDQRVRIRLLDHLPRVLAWTSGMDVGCLLHLLQLDVLDIRTDHADSLGEMIPGDFLTGCIR